MAVADIHSCYPALFVASIPGWGTLCQAGRVRRAVAEAGNER